MFIFLPQYMKKIWKTLQKKQTRLRVQDQVKQNITQLMVQTKKQQNNLQLQNLL